jgi:hypothetical protein
MASGFSCYMRVQKKYFLTHISNISRPPFPARAVASLILYLEVISNVHRMIIIWPLIYPMQITTYQFARQNPNISVQDVIL